MESQPAPLSVRNGPSGIPRPASRIPTPSTQGRKRPAAPVSPVEMCIEGQENPSVEPVAKRPKMTATVKPIRAEEPVVTKKAAVQTKKAPVKAAPKKPVAKKPPTRPASNKPKGVAAAKPPAKASTATAVAGANAKSGAAGGKTKRPAWDVKGRLQDVEAERNQSKETVRALSKEMELVRQRLDSLQSENSQQETTLKMKQQETSMASERIRDAEEKLRVLEAKHRELQREHSALQSVHAGTEMDLVASRSAISQLTTDYSTLQCRYDALKVSKDEAVAESSRKSDTISKLELEVESHLATIAECEARRREDETIRRQLHNVIQELKGNIRVFCRVRPILPADTDSVHHRSGCKGGAGSAESKLDVVFPDPKKITLAYTEAASTSGAAGQKSYNFEFDRVFDPTSTQQDVFGEISQLVQSALDGYNVCIFAYGQTGSGKTHTMEGAGEDDGGMIPRAVHQVFNTAMGLKERGWEYSMQASFLEIYNETIRDLLASSTAKPCQHDIKLDPSVPGGVYVSNIDPIAVKSAAQVATLLDRANKNRAVAATNCNERSSRSHSVFRLQLIGSNDITAEKCKGSLNLVDLAGSERLAQSGSVGERLKETKNINKSLSNLGQVIMALSNKEPHVPYRNSKLTFLLQNSLGGNSKTLMFVNMSPVASSMQETLCSLRFATKVNQCNIGTARKAIK